MSAPPCGLLFCCAGGGFIGIEMVENLVSRGLATTLVEMQSQVGLAAAPEGDLGARVWGFESVTRARNPEPGRFSQRAQSA